MRMRAWRGITVIIGVHIASPPGTDRMRTGVRMIGDGPSNFGPLGGRASRTQERLADLRMIPKS
jgi:hypothetical protein